MVEAILLNLVNLIFFFVFPVDDRKGHFEIDSQSGEIKVTARFDKSHHMNYTIRVVATDNGAAPVEQTALVHIQVTLQGSRQISK